MRKVFFFMQVMQCPQGHSLPWVFTPAGGEQNIPPCYWWPASERQWWSTADTELPGQGPSHAVLDPSHCRPYRLGNPAAPRYSKVTAVPESFIPAGTRTSSLWAKLCIHDTHLSPGPRGWSASGACRKTSLANSNAVLSTQIMRDCIAAIFITAD